ncbi:MAG: hypothetical protein FWE05_07890 [Defluviitaleaceae bacterium]|nr:hypothetical protein [Defluviitaleaceae bacterium]
MFSLDYLQQDTIGLTYVLNQLTPDSPFGVEAKKRIAPLGYKNALENIFDNMEKIINLLHEDEKSLKKLRTHLKAFKNIRGSMIHSQIFTQVELFEIKHFLITFEKLMLAYKKLSIDFVGLELYPMDVPLAIIDPDGRRIGTFSFTSPVLEEIRTKKRYIEKQNLMTERPAIVEQEVEEETRIAVELSMQLKKYTELFLINMDTLGKLDITIAKVMLATKLQATRPQLSETLLSFKNMSNPYVEDALVKMNQNMTQISLSMTTGVTMITGANMGGKSVALKTVVLNTILCQLGFFVFAEFAEIPIFDDIHLISEDMQDIGQGLSSFGAEVLRLNEIIECLKSKRLLIALDEFARGTNPTEGAAIVRAVAAYLHESDTISIMSTHYNKVVSPEYKHYQVAGLNFPDTLQQWDVSSIAQNMDYALVEVSSETPPPQDAINICKMIGLNKSLLIKIQEGMKEYD